MAPALTGRPPESPFADGRPVASPTAGHHVRGQRVPCRSLERVRGGGGGVGAAGWGAPGQHAGCGMFEPPSLGLLAPVVVTARRSVATYAGIVGHSRVHF